MKNSEKRYISIPELARLLGVSRIAVYKQVKKGKIKAVKIGRNYAISRDYIGGVLGERLNKEQKKEIDRAVKKTVSEYGETLKLLGKE